MFHKPLVIVEFMNCICLLLFCVLTHFLASVNLSAGEKYNFRTLSPDGGFYYDGVKDIEQDGEGFIWVMLDYELYRFDGYQYKKYYPLFASMDATSRWIFYHLAADSGGCLYVNTNNGLYRYESVSDTFQRIFDEVEEVKVDGKDGVWVYRSGKWHALQGNRLVTPVYEGKEEGAFSRQLCFYNQDIYSFSHRTVYRWNDAKKRFYSCFTLPGGTSRIRFAQARAGKLWLFVAQEGLYKVDLATMQILEKCELPGLENFIPRTLHVDKMNQVWMGSMNGLYVYDAQHHKIQHYVHQETDPFSLPNNSVWTISEDRQSNLWIGTYSGKLCYVNIHETHPFQRFHVHNSGLSDAPVSAFAEDKKGVWIGTEGGGINRLDKKSGRIFPLNPNLRLSSRNIKSLLMDEYGSLWITTFMGGMYEFNEPQRRVIRYSHLPRNPHSMLVNNVRKIVAEADSGLWVAYQNPEPKISYFSYRTRLFTHYALDAAHSYDYLFDLLRQGENTLWAISNEALYKMNIQTHTVEKIVPKDSAYYGFSTFCLDDEGNIWIGTIGHGLVRFDTSTSEFILMQDRSDFDLYSVYSICFDDGCVWMGTDDGLYCYYIAENRLMNFDKQENTQGQVYYPLAVMKGSDGKLYFGGTEGVTVVQPDKVRLNDYRPKALISDFLIDHQVVPPHYKMKDSLAVITLAYDQENFGFRFSSDNYHIPEKNRFKYRLKGYADNWVTVDAQQRQVMFSKVPAGTYYFEVLAANNDGVWGTRPTVIRIVRQAAPWFSWYAYALYLLFTIGVIYAIYRHYADKKKLQMQLYHESVERDKKEQIHQAQLRFFTNISHDFRTPLSLILAALDKLRREGLKEYYYHILNGNVQRLLNLVNELMDFRTVENGKMRLELEPLSLFALVQELANDFMDYAQQRNITFRVVCDEALPQEVFADKNVVGKIVMNLLNNAFKYTKDGGEIELEIRQGKKFVSQYKNSFTLGECSGEGVMLIVRDTGVGISAESISSVFERFYKVNTVNADSHLGTGIGLALVKSLVLLHKGAITIFSERDKGTDMVVTLPVDKALFDEADFKKQALVHPDEKEENTEAADMEEQEMVLPASGRKILIVEDNQDLRELIAESLSDEFRVVQAADGLEALEKVEEMEFDLIISDIMMPNKDGVSLCHDLKTNVETSHIPVILLTAKTSLESKMEGADSGADLYFEKPIDFTYLKLAIKNVFRNRQQLKDHYAKNYYADSSELSTNEEDSKFLTKLVGFIEAHIDQSDMDVNQIARELMMSRSKLYTKVKSLTGKSVVEFVLNCRMRKAAKLIIEENLTMREVMMQIGIESQPYFTNSFKKVFGETPTSFATKHKNRQKDNLDKSKNE